MREKTARLRTDRSPDYPWDDPYTWVGRLSEDEKRRVRQRLVLDHEEKAPSGQAIERPSLDRKGDQERQSTSPRPPDADVAPT